MIQILYNNSDMDKRDSSIMSDCLLSIRPSSKV